MKTIEIKNPDGETAGNIYQYRRGFYHTTQTDYVHGPFKTADQALKEWCDTHRKDPAYFTAVGSHDGISGNVRTKIREQHKRVTESQSL